MKITRFRVLLGGNENVEEKVFRDWLEKAVLVVPAPFDYHFAGAAEPKSTKGGR